MDSFAPHRLVGLDVPGVDVVYVLVVAADSISRAGLSSIINSREGYEVAGVASPDDDLQEAVAAFSPDVILWDLATNQARELPEWFEVEVPVVALLPDESLLADAWGAGARTLLLREASPAAIAAALLAAREGLFVFDAAFAAQSFSFSGASTGATDLTPREREVLSLLAEGLPNKSIADRLGITPNTAKFHVAALLGKLGAHSRTEAVTRAARLGYLVL